MTERVAASRAAQGLPPRVQDPAALARIAALIARKEVAAPARAAREARQEAAGDAG